MITIAGRSTRYLFHDRSKPIYWRTLKSGQLTDFTGVVEPDP
jgi:hypothetical protein